MKNLYADIIVNISISKLDRSFQYRIPPRLEKQVSEGSKVRVPFGNASRIIDGYVIGIGREAKCDVSIIKDIDSCPENYVTVEEKLIQLAAWIKRTYGSTFVQALKTVLPVKETKKGKSNEEESFEDEMEELREIKPLSQAQQDVYDKIKKEFNNKYSRPCLMRGVTGSGKTHVYMHLIADEIAKGRQAILLIPEISLTWQTVSRFYACFGNKTAVLHSKMSKGEKTELLKRIRAGRVSLVIGPRSALFVPFDKLGIIIIDEEHDSSYQSDMTPRYQTRDVAEKRARLENANLLLGSATPSLESRYACEINKYALFELENRYSNAVMPNIIVADMRKESTYGKKPILGERLIEEMAVRLENKEQIILFLNKRGHTGVYTCRSCGYVIKCPHCDVALTYHNNGLLMCHYCGYSHKMVDTCPSCESPYIGGYKIGTQKAEETVKKIFPQARVVRMDRDTTTKKDSHESIIKDFAAGNADILIGTQMIVKGHDFPRVTLVGILAADISLYAGDFRAAERTYQLIVQAVGRAGRGVLPGCGIIQTYNPNHYAIRAAAIGDYEAFYAEEAENRRVMNYVPMGCHISVHAASPDYERLSNAMAHIRLYIENYGNFKADVLGPAPEVVAKVRDQYKMVLYIKAQSIAEIIRIRQYTEKYIEINRGFDGINIQFSLNN